MVPERASAPASMQGGSVLSAPPTPPYGPAGPSGDPWSARPPTKGGRLSPAVVIAILVITVAVLATVVVAAVTLFAREKRDGYSGALRKPILIQPVEAVDPPPCATGALPTADRTECLRLQEARLTIRRVEDIRVTLTGAGTGAYSISVTLKRDDAATFEELTTLASAQPTGSPSRRLAMVVDGRVLMAPTVEGRLTQGKFVISGSFTRTEAENAVRTMTGSG